LLSASSDTATGVNIGSVVNQQLTGSSVFDWATDLPTENRFKSLVGETELQSDEVASGAEQPFTPYETRRMRSKRQRRESRQENQQTSSTAQQKPAARENPRSRRGPLMIGKSAGSTTNSSITAAHGWYRKSVFYVDNVNDDVSADDLAGFVRSLSVRLVSCIQVNPRRRRNDSDSFSSRAFRLCINRDDRELLLNADKWPAYVAISDWIFKPPNTAQESNKRQKTVEQLSAGASVVKDVVSTDVVVDMDTTILAGTSAYSDPDCSLINN
jgi:hypothetical protein